jgi:hypothetical protein
MTGSFRRFRMQTFKDAVGDPDNENPGEKRSESIRKRHKRELAMAEQENRENTSALLELRDMEDELKTLLRLFNDQQTVVQNMKDIFQGDDLRHLTRNALNFLNEALTRLVEYKAQTQGMLTRVDTTRNDYEKLLEMVQRQAQVDEVRWSRLQTELASSQNLSVMIFTTFTVIFLPLTFFTGLFGMNTLEWGGDQFLPLGTIGAIALPASAFIISISLVAAFSGRVQSVVKSVIKRVKNGAAAARAGVEKLEPAATREKKEKKRDGREKIQARAKRRREGGYDFWVAVRRQRASEYRIPELNRKKA